MTFTEHCCKDHSLPDICCPDPGIEFTMEEIKVLYELLERQYIHYENTAALELVRKLRTICEV